MYYLCFLASLLILIQSEAIDVPQLLTSYSQVSHSGSARSHARQSWRRSESQENLLPQKKNNRRFSAPAKGDKSPKFEDGIGEVVQERFNPRPWIAYEAVLNKGPTYLPSSVSDHIHSKPSNGEGNSDLSVPFDSFPLSVPTNKEKLSPLLKAPFAPVSSPASVAIVTAGNEDFPSPLNTYGSPYDSYHPQQKPKSPTNFVTPSVGYMPSEDESDKSKSQTPMSDMEYSSEKESDFDYIDHQKDYSNHDHNGHHDMSNGASQHTSQDIGFSSYLDHDPNQHGNSFEHHFVHDHPAIYYEIKPPATTEAPEHERLNKKLYSYYYIGRKLFYIPLYFSVYFIIYIFVLILKSIARHKITFNHYFEEDKREMKDVHEEHIHKLNHHVSNDIINARRKYII